MMRHDARRDGKTKTTARPTIGLRKAHHNLGAFVLWYADPVVLHQQMRLIAHFFASQINARHVGASMHHSIVEKVQNGFP